MLSLRRWVAPAVVLGLLVPRGAHAQSAGTVQEDRNPRLATTGMVLTFSGLAGAALGGGLLGAMVASGPGRSYDELGRQAAMGLGSGLLIAGSAATLTGIVLWAVGESDVERERVRITYPGRDEGQRNDDIRHPHDLWHAQVTAGPSSIQLTVSF